MDIIERNKKVEENLALVGFSLKQLGIPYNEDYFQQGVLELIRCVECYKEGSRYKFSTYAVKNITLKLKEYIMRDKVLKPKRTGVGGQVYAPFCASLDSNVGLDGEKEITLGDTIACEDDEFSKCEIMMDLESMVSQGIITCAELDIFLKHTVYGEKLSDVGKCYNIKHQQVFLIVEHVRIEIKKYLSYNK